MYASTNRHFWFYYVCIVFLLLLFVILMKNIKNNLNKNSENFRSITTTSYCNAYDKYYVDYYNELFKPEDRLQFDVMKFLSLEPSPKDSVILDVGCGTGIFTNEINNYGYNITGLDVNNDCINKSLELNSKLAIKCGDAVNPLLFPKESFTHITSLYFTLYEISNKEQVFSNIFDWLNQGGFFIVHLVDIDNFSMIPPCANVREDIVREFSDKRVETSTVTFPSYIYKSSYTKDDNIISVNESLVSNSEERIYKRNLYVSDMKYIIKQIEMSGLKLLSIDDYASIHGDFSQFICIFKK